LIRAVFIDADGTLVGPEGVPDCVWPAVEKARAYGLRLVLTTGRLGEGETLALAERLDPEGCHVFQSGAVIYCNGRVVEAFRLPQTPYHLAVDLARVEAVALEAYASGGGFFAEREARVLRDHESLLGLKAKKKDLHAVYFAQVVVRAQFVVEEARWPALRPRVLALGLDLHEATSPKTPGVVYASLTAPGVGKRAAAEAVLQRLGLTFDEAAAIGDGKNDLELLRAVRLGIAMANAPEEVRAAANWIAPPPEACGLVAALEKVLEAA